jgi:HAE1 family hydrophobic/amphiphilic exporter-1
MNNISSWSIRNPIPIILLFALLTIGGVLSFLNMRINNNPDIDFPLVAVTAVRPGAAPSEMEVQVTRLIEDSLAGLSGVRHINSQITDGVSATTIEFELGTDTERATNDVRNAMGSLRADLPQDMQEPSVQRIDITGEALITWVISSETMTPEEISWFVDNDVSRTLLAIKGVGEVNRGGGVDREIAVELDPDRLASYGLTAAAVSQALTSVNSDQPGGRVTISGSERSIRTLGSATSIEALRETIVPLSGGRSVRLGDLGRVRRVVKVLGMVNGIPTFADHPKVINGCSDLFVNVFGDAGKHARSAVGMGSLPGNITVEIEVIFQVDGSSNRGDLR